MTIINPAIFLKALIILHKFLSAKSAYEEKIDSYWLSWENSLMIFDPDMKKIDSYRLYGENLLMILDQVA